MEVTVRQSALVCAACNSKCSQSLTRAHVSARLSRHQTHRERVYRPLQFDEGSQHFIGTDDETFSVAMRVNNPDRSPFAIER